VKEAVEEKGSPGKKKSAKKGAGNTTITPS
jgi:hypothetical protein